MKAFFAPAIALMNRLTYPRKFALISVLFVLPLAFVTVVLLREMNQVTAFSQKELAGVQYLRPLRRFFEGALKIRLAVYASIDGKAPLDRRDLNALQEGMDADLGELSVLDARMGASLQTAIPFGTVRDRWQTLRGQTDASHSAAGIARELNPLIPEIRDLIRRVGDSSNLILDPEVDSYYLAAGLVHDVPENQELTAQLFVLAEQTDVASPNPGEQAEVNTLRHVLSTSAAGIPDSVNMSLKGTHSATLAATIDPALQSFRADSQNFLSLLDSLNFSQKRLPEYGALGRRSLASSFGLWDRMADGLEGLLRARVAATLRQKETVVAVSAAALLVVLYLWLGFYMAVMRMVSRMGEAARRMQGGHFDEVALDSRDELAAVVRSFNNVAASLKASEGTLRAVLDSSPVPILITRFPEWKVLYGNKALGDLLGHSQERLMGIGVEDFYHDMTLRPKVRAELSAQGRVRQFEMPVRRADGGAVWISLSLERITFGDQGAALSALYDLTERRRAEESIRESEERLRLVLDASPEPLMITRFPEWKVLYGNKALLDLFGYSREQWLGLGVADFYFDPSLRPKVHAEIAATGRLREFEQPLRRADGGPVWVSTSLEVIQFGKDRAAVSGLHDLTERRRSEEALKASEDRFRAIAEATPIPVAIAHVDDDRIVYSNRSVNEMFGIPQDLRLEDRSAADSYAEPGGRARMLAALKPVGALRDYEVRLKKVDGTQFWVSLSATAITYGDRACVLTTFFDLDARKRLELDLQRAAETLKAANESLAQSRDNAEVRAERAQLTMLRYQLNPHFLFNSLNTLRAFILAEPEKARDMVTRLAAFCRLSLTRPETETVPLREEWALLDHYLAMEKYRWGDRLAIESSLDPAAEETPVLPFLLQPLVENAVKYGQRTSPAQLGIRLSARIANGLVELEIANSGRWLNPGDHDVEGTRTGLENLRTRLRQLYHNNASFDIGERGGWVVARLVLPFASPEDHSGPDTPA